MKLWQALLAVTLAMLAVAFLAWVVLTMFQPRM